MKIGFLFPGQGAQTIGMGKDLFDKYDEVKNVYNKVKEITGIDIAKISFEGPEEELNKTQNTQLAILTESLAILEVLKNNNISAQMLAGLSLGEYTGLIQDEILDFETGVKLVQKRGEIMQNLIPSGNWKMAAVMGLEDKIVEEVCYKIRNDLNENNDEQVLNVSADENNNEENFVVPANYNTIGQIVISGNEKAVLKAEELLKQNGAKKVAILNTAGPFHTSKLENASAELKNEIKKLHIDSKDSKVVKNIDGSLYKSDDIIDEVLGKHIMNPVRFTKCLKTMYDNGIDTFIEIGPGKTLSGFVKRMKFENEVKILNINNCETLENVLKEVNVNE